MLYLLNLLTFSYSHLLIFPCARMFIFPFPQILGTPGHVLGRNQGRNLKFSIAFHSVGSGDHIPRDTARHGRSHSPQGHGAPQTQPFPPWTQRATDATVPPRDTARHRRQKHFSSSTHTCERGADLYRFLTRFQKVDTCPTRARDQRKCANASGL